jgi:hypothetical protein
MRTVNIVSNGKVTESNVVANDHEKHYINGNKYVEVLLGGHWTKVRAEKLETVKSNPFAVL